MTRRVRVTVDVEVEDSLGNADLAHSLMDAAWCLPGVARLVRVGVKNARSADGS